jgi:hypothetical protein
MISMVPHPRRIIDVFTNKIREGRRDKNLKAWSSPREREREGGSKTREVMRTGTYVAL